MIIDAFGKPFVLDKGSYICKINLVNKDEVISDDLTLGEKFSKFFESNVENLGISEEIRTRADFESSNPGAIALLKYKYHLSILKIKEFVGENISEFYFSETTRKILKMKLKNQMFLKKVPLKIFHQNVC